ncbi:hypothetical protein BGX31_000130 [Mortierella sp. GBA43]|nr:hypothetical protein BGX31_000130 [Mortierella sp. GBA43]
MASSFLSMQPLFKQNSGDNSSDVDETMESIEGDADNSQDISGGSIDGSLAEADTAAKPAKKTRKKATTTATAALTPAEVQSEEAANSTVPPEATNLPTTTVATAMVSPSTTDPAAVPGEPVKKKKGPKKGTKYKKRVPKVDGAAPGVKAPKAPKMTKKAAAAAAEAAKASQLRPPDAARLDFQNTVIDMDHPLESFKWPYSPFTPEFRSQHQARNKMASDLRQAVQQIADTNGRATWHLRELDQKLQMSRQDLKTSLDEIQFRKSQLRDMSLLAVDIVRKLSSPRPRHPQGKSSSPGAASGNESNDGGECPSSCPTTTTTTTSHLDGDRMDVDEVESGKEQYPQLQQSSLKGLNEGNVRSFLEKIRELEQAQHHVMV